ncbi:helix-turn-helix domain-containing protein [Celeribacter baekdonensis]|uniref:Uncharacterized protein n=1 Tax=Celeribacter baekdonensis TaxID=875171 RepID=A0A2R4M0K1_9RHOB|nr:helix-turn-helix domain-containing protein [Celeribacter baekdonensis]AVW90648.1 hypothetical protein DA792_05725 [Celeribacter baekdonensis]
MTKRVTSRRVKIHRQYTYDQAAMALGVSLQTVRGWRREGLPVLTSKVPHLIIGAELKAFLDRRSTKSKLTLTLEQFRCMRCGGSVAAYGGMVDYTPLTSERGVLSTLCATCEGACTKFASRAQVDALSHILSVTFCNSR